MDATVTIGCSLPHGLTLQVNWAKKGEPANYEFCDLQGLLKARKGAKYGTAKVPLKLWLVWVAENNTLRYLIEGAVFVLDKDGKTKLHALTMKVIK